MVPPSFTNTLKQHFTNALGSKTGKKIIVFESDDWGSVRMPSREVYGILSKRGLIIDDHYNRYDSLATEYDLYTLFDLLESVKDHKGNHPAFTANCLVANPDFDRIREAKFEKYFYEPFTETLENYPGCQKSFELWQQGIETGLFRPQFHGREHLNVPTWLAALQLKDRDALLGFDSGFWGHTIRDVNARRSHYLAAYDFNSEEESNYVSEAAAEGIEMFEKIFGYRSKSFIAPNFVWSHGIEKTLGEYGASLIQGQRNQLIPIAHKSPFLTKFHYMGHKNKLGQKYLVRNCYFEPSSNPNKDWVSSCLKDISNAFLWKTPAIISAHRVNFIGAITPENRERNLKCFRELLREIIIKWEDVEFMTSDQLETIIPK